MVVFYLTKKHIVLSDANICLKKDTMQYKVLLFNFNLTF